MNINHHSGINTIMFRGLWITLTLFALGCTPRPDIEGISMLKEGTYLVAYRPVQWQVIIEDNGVSKHLKSINSLNQCLLWINALGRICTEQKNTSGMRVVAVDSPDLEIYSGELLRQDAGVAFTPIRIHLEPGKINYIGEIAIDWIKADRKYPDQTMHHRYFRIWFTDRFEQARKDLKRYYGPETVEIVDRTVPAPLHVFFFSEYSSNWMKAMIRIGDTVKHPNFPMPSNQT